MARWPLILGLLLATAPTAIAEDEPAEEEECPELSEDEVTELFQPYADAIASGQKKAAADALLPILDDRDSCAAHAQAHRHMGDLYREFGMDYSALVSYSRAMDADLEIGKEIVAPALDIANKVGDTRILGPVFAKNVGVATDKAIRSQVAYVAAKHNVQNGDFGVALGMLLMVEKKSPLYVDAEALRGVVLANQGRPNDALAPLLTAQALGKKGDKSDRFLGSVAINVARAYFAAGNYQRAVQYYAKVERGSDYWPDAWFEKAWSHFRAQDMNGALGALMVQDSPFYRDGYWPEADLLRAYSLFLMCKFKDATAEIDAFNERYQPIYASLSSVLGNYDEAAAWKDILALTSGEETTVPTSVIANFQKDERLLGAVATVAKAEEEIARLSAQAANPFAGRAIKTLRSRQNEIKMSEAKRIIAKATQARDELKDMLSNLKITKLDMMQFETRQLEQAAITGEMDTATRLGQMRKLRAKPGTRLWPWQGEYWADEVGYYNVVSPPDCPDSLRPQGP